MYSVCVASVDISADLTIFGKTPWLTPVLSITKKSYITSNASNVFSFAGLFS